MHDPEVLYSGGNNDECMTLPYAVEPIIKYIPKDAVVWCPFDKEDSEFVKQIKANGNKVIYSHIDNGQDFFTYEPDEHYDIIISNPPFSKKDKVLKRLDELGKPFAMLLPANSIQGNARYQNCFKNGIQMLCFNYRIDYHTNFNFQTYTKGNHFASAYFCRDVLPKDLIVEELIKYERSLK